MRESELYNLRYLANEVGEKCIIWQYLANEVEAGLIWEDWKLDVDKIFFLLIYSLFCKLKQ
jgi:hypothetical protein